MPSNISPAPIQIFLSYAREDYQAVSQLYDRLAEVGLKPWMDKRDILLGERWETKLQQAIAESHFFLACLSSKSVTKRGYLQKEFKKALDLWQEKLNSDIYLIPVRLDECEVPEEFRQFQWGNLYEPDDWWALLRSIRAGAERQGLVAPAQLVSALATGQQAGVPKGGMIRSLRARSVGFAVALVAIAVLAILAWIVPGFIRGTSPAVQATATSALPTSMPLRPTDNPIPPDPTVPAGKVVSTDEGITVAGPIIMEFVRIPAGELLMGTDPAKDSQAENDENPLHRVALAEYYIGKYEVTNAQYAAFVKATDHAAPIDWQNRDMPAGTKDHPVVRVSWDDATAFTQWLGSEMGMSFRLCSEAEWEKACRGDSGLIYPWGDAFDAHKANTYESGPGTAIPVGKYSPNGDSRYGVADMSGNVWEWVADWYSDTYYANSLSENPQGPASGDNRVWRGGSFYNGAGAVRCASRFQGDTNYRSDSGGFRVCVSPGL